MALKRNVRSCLGLAWMKRNYKKFWFESVKGPAESREFEFSAARENMDQAKLYCRVCFVLSSFINKEKEEIITKYENSP